MMSNSCFMVHVLLQPVVFSRKRTDGAAVSVSVTDQGRPLDERTDPAEPAAVIRDGVIRCTYQYLPRTTLGRQASTDYPGTYGGCQSLRTSSRSNFSMAKRSRPKSNENPLTCCGSKPA